MGLAGVIGRDAEHLVVAALLIGHPEHPDGPAVDQTAREVRFADEDQRVERVSVVAQSALDEAVVGRVLGRGEQRPVQPDPPRQVVYLVLVALAFRNLDRHVESHCHLADHSEALL